MAKQRSPRAPSIDLETALERARVLYGEEKANAAPVDTVLAHWGYNSRNGRSLTLLASVKQYGLIQDEGSGDQRAVRLTDLALGIIRDPREESPEREKAIQMAALTPRVHRQVLEEYPDGLPSEGSLQWFLIQKLGFTDTGAKEFTNQFRRTIAFAKLDPSATLSEDDEDTEVTTEAPERPSSDVSQPPGGVKPHPSPFDDPSRIVNIPAGRNNWVQLNATFPMSAEAWDQMMNVLEAMKPSLVADEDEMPYQDKLPEDD